MPRPAPLARARWASGIGGLLLGLASAGAAWSAGPPVNNPPVISGTPPLTVAEQGTYSFTPTASDADGHSLRFSVVGKPIWARFDSATGTLSGSPSLTQAGVYSGIVISVTDGRTQVSLPTFNLTVTNTNVAPVVSGSPPLRVTAGKVYKFEPVVSDADGDVLTFSYIKKPGWLSVNSTTGKLWGQPKPGTDKLFKNVKITVSDGTTTVDLPWFNIDVAPAVGRKQPAGIYSLDRVVNKPFVHGVVVRARWSDLEPTEGVYDFSEIDEAIRAASAVGQSVTIATLPNFAPSWLIAKVQGTPDQVFVDARGYQNIVPWNETMLLALEKLVKAHAAHTVDGVKLGAHPAVKQINASIGGVTSVRLIVQPPGYTYEKFAAAVERSLDFWATAFPTGPHLYVGMFYFNPTNQSPPSSDVMLEYLLNRYDGVARPRMHYFQELLTGLAPATGSQGGMLLKTIDSRAGVMLQACGPWVEQGSPNWTCNWLLPSDSPSLGADLAIREYGSVYLEFYPDDLENPGYATQFESMKTSLESALNAAATLAGH